MWKSGCHCYARFWKVLNDIFLYELVHVSHDRLPQSVLNRWSPIWLAFIYVIEASGWWNRTLTFSKNIIPWDSYIFKQTSVFRETYTADGYPHCLLRSTETNSNGRTTHRLSHPTMEMKFFDILCISIVTW